MKYISFFKHSLLMASVALAVSACSEDVNYGSTQLPSGGNGSAEGDLVYVTDANGSVSAPSIEYRDNGTVELNAVATAPVSEPQSILFSYDAQALEDYNTANGSSFEAVPESMVSLADNGVATIAKGETTSSPMVVTLTSDGSLDSEKTYVIPLKVAVAGDSRASVAKASQTIIVFVKDLTALPDCNKMVTDSEGNLVPGVKIFSVMEVNDTNPLNNLRFTLKNSGKYMVDALVMFAGNINYDVEKGRVYFFANPNVQHLLDNREKYLKPLQDRGMKVIMGVMCNHDRACIANLSDETARMFAQELKSVADAYHLDGFFWDDEYCNPIYPAPPGFVNPSNAAFSRLAYEVWKLNPNFWNVAYGYSTTSRAQTVDGVKAGTYITYVLPDYGYGMPDYSTAFEGMPVEHMGAYSMEFAQGRYKSESQLRQMREAGRGALMLFAMDPYRTTRNGQDSAMGSCARALYDDEVVIDSHRYAKDW